MPSIISGAYCGPVDSLQGQRALIMSQDRHAVPNTSIGEDADILIQWDDLGLFEAHMVATGANWIPYKLSDFCDFHLTCDEDVV